MKLKLNSAFAIFLITGVIVTARAQTAPTNSPPTADAGWSVGKHILLVGGAVCITTTQNGLVKRIADHSNIQLSFIVPLIAYAYVAFYGAVGHRFGKAKV